MLKNIILIVGSFATICLNFYGFKRRKTIDGGIKKIIIALLAFWLLIVFLPNISLIISPFSQQIKGQVIDAETKQPIANCNIQVYWMTESIIYFSGAHQEAYHNFHSTTDSNGRFIVPKYQKSIGIYLFPIFIDRYSGMKIITFDHNHKYKEFIVKDNKIRISLTKEEKPINQDLLVELVPFKIKNQFVEDLYYLGYEIFTNKNFHNSVPDYFNRFAVSSCSHYLTTNDISSCDNSSVVEISRLSVFMESINAVNKAIELQMVIKQLCPSSKRQVDNEITRLKSKSNIIRR